MKQQINLFLPEFQRRQDPLSTARMLAVTGVAVLLLAAVSGLEYWQLRSLEAEHAAVRQELTEATQRTNQVLDNLRGQSEDQDLVARVAELENTVDNKRTLLEFLERRDLGNTDGFSEHLADLARYHVEGLRLTRVELTGGGDAVRLGGEVRLAENVPLYLQSLSQGRSYAGKSFETVRIDTSEGEDSGQALEFEVATVGRDGP